LGAGQEGAKAKPPFWAANGVLVYRVFTPDASDVLTHAEVGVKIVSNLLDGSVPQIPMFNGIIGHDHPGAWNWDGAWPCWNRVTFRAGNRWETLAGFMARIRDHANARASFHVNLTDVNIGLRDYPETRAFFQKLVETRSIYRRDWNPATKQRDAEPPYVPREIDRFISESDGKVSPNPVPIFALVNYKRFWDSGLAKQMLDEFYGHLPYPPPMLYLDVLTLSGGNFSTGFPDGPLGGSKDTQLEGVVAIVDYLRTKGTDLGTEGNRNFLGDNPDGSARAGYVWYHGDGFSRDDYGVVSGGNKMHLAAHHVFGNPGAFAIAPIASTPAGLATVHSHYKALLAGQPGTKAVPGMDTWHIPKRSSETQVDEFDVPGANGDVFRGDWADLVNYFYLAVIQENYHIGKRNVRQRFASQGDVHLGRYVLRGAGDEIAVSVPDFVEGWQGKSARNSGQIMLESPIETKAHAADAGDYRLKVVHKVVGRSENAHLNVYVNGKLHRTFLKLPKGAKSGDWQELDAGTVALRQGENAIAFDAGPIKATRSDGTTAEWTTPYLRKGFRAWNGDVVFAEDYDRMWPDTWSGQKKVYFYSWDGTSRPWKLPPDWSSVRTALLYPLTPAGRGSPVQLDIAERRVAASLLPQVPYVLIPAENEGTAVATP
jgi:hypothetical protein